MEPVSIAVVTLGALASSGVVSYFQDWLKRKLSRTTDVGQLEQTQTLDSRLADLSKSMSDASELMLLVQAEIQARQDKVAKLADEVKQQEQLAKLTKDAKDAVAAVFQAELVRQGKRARWETFWFGVVFFLLGSAVTYGVTYFVHPYYN